MTIRGYDKPILDLIDGLNKTGHVTHTKHKKKSVTLHHNGAHLTRRGVLRVWQTRPASAHFDVDMHGRLAQYVKPNEYAWAVGDTQGNIETISIEMCNEVVGHDWKVAEVTWHEAARFAGFLFAHIIDDRPNRNNLFYHHHWKSTSCAGPYMDKHYEQVLDIAQKSFHHFSR